jgi:hypothetical protein
MSDPLRDPAALLTQEGNFTLHFQMDPPVPYPEVYWFGYPNWSISVDYYP